MKRNHALTALVLAGVILIGVGVFAISRAFSAISYYGSANEVLLAWIAIALGGFFTGMLCIFAAVVSWSVFEVGKKLD